MSAMVLRTSSVLILESATALVETARLTASWGEGRRRRAGERSVVSTEKEDPDGRFTAAEGKEIVLGRGVIALGAGIMRVNVRESPGTCTAKVPTNAVEFDGFAPSRRSLRGGLRGTRSAARGPKYRGKTDAGRKP